jgi:hypothetical protein
MVHWKVLLVAELRDPGGDEELRDALDVEVFADRQIRRRAQRPEDQQHFLVLDQLACLFNRLRRAVAVVQADEPDPAAVDASFVVDLVEVGLHRPAGHHPLRRQRTAIGHALPDLDLGVRYARPMLCPAQTRAADYQCQGRGGSDDQGPA